MELDDAPAPQPRQLMAVKGPEMWRAHGTGKTVSAVTVLKYVTPRPSRPLSPGRAAADAAAEAAEEAAARAASGLGVALSTPFAPLVLNTTTGVFDPPPPPAPHAPPPPPRPPARRRRAAARRR